MITNSKQNWNVGCTVRVGFHTLIVKAAIETPGDYAPDAYILTNMAGTQLYKFVPHNGLQKIDAAEVTAMLETQKLIEFARQRRIDMADAARTQIAALFGDDGDPHFIPTKELSNA